MLPSQNAQTWDHPGPLLVSQHSKCIRHQWVDGFILYFVAGLSYDDSQTHQLFSDVTDVVEKLKPPSTKKWNWYMCFSMFFLIMLFYTSQRV